MPILRVSNKNVLFAHVPKCAGSSIEDTLIRNGFSLSFLDRTHLWHRDKKKCVTSSPQHFLATDLDLLFEPGFFDYKFAVVRDPVNRFLSAFNHNRRAIGNHVSINSFINKLEDHNINSNDYYGRRLDNHFVPAKRFIPNGAKIFYLEDGIELIIKSLSDDLECQFEYAGERNVSPYRLRSKDKFKEALKNMIYPKSPLENDLTNAQKNRIINLYAEDFEYFTRYS